MSPSFKFLSFQEFAELNVEEQCAYISAAAAALKRIKVDNAAGGWHTLFRQEAQPERESDSQ